MAGGVELGTAYVSLVIDSKQVPGQIKSALGGVSAQGDVAGQGIGARMASGIGSAFKVGGAAIGAAAALTIGTALNKGMERVVAIDDAKGKLAGLGHSTEGVATIMDSALKSVKGTAYGLGDAAGIAASAVAAGIKPGEELTKYLSLTGDAATIAGSSLGEMGSIFNKVQTSGKAYTDNLNQLSDRGIPIFQWLQDEYGVSSEALAKMVKEGKVDAETFNKVIQENIGGAALESGKTLRGSFANMKAALGRAGASVIEPFVPMMKAGLGKITEFTDKVTPFLKAGAEKVASGLTDMGRAFMSSGASVDGAASNFEKFGIKARMVVDGIQGVWSILTKGDHLGAAKTFGLEEDSGTVQMLLRIRDGAIALWAALKSPSGEKFSGVLDAIKGSGDGAAGTMGKVESGASTLMGALKAVGAAAAGGGIALASLGGDTATVAVAGIKALGGVMSFFADHTGLATVALGGLAAAFVATKAAQTGYDVAFIARTIMMPAQTASQIAMTRALNAHSAVLRAHIITLGGSLPAEQASLLSRARLAITTRLSAAATASATSGLLAYAAAQRAAAASSGLLIGGIRQAAASTAVMGARMGALGGTALGGLRAGLGGAVSLLGGPVSAGIMAAGAAALYMGSKFSDANEKIKNSQKVYRDYAVSVRDSNNDLKNAFNKSNGVADSGVMSVVEAQINSARTAQKDFADSAPGIWGGIGSSISTMWDSVDGRIDGTAMKTFSTAEDLGKKGRAASAAFDKLNLSTSDLAKVVTGPTDAYKAFTDQILKTTEGGGALVDIFNQQRQSFHDAQQPASEFEAAIKAINDGSVSAAQGIDAMSSAMARQRGEANTVGDAQQRVNDSLRSFSEAAANAGASVVMASGEIDTGTAAGSRLRTEVKNMQAAMDDAGSAAYTNGVKMGQSHADAAQAAVDASLKVQESFIDAAEKAGIPREAVMRLIEQYNLIPPNKTTYVAAETADAERKLGNLIALQNNLRNNMTITPPTAAPFSTPLPFDVFQNARGSRLPKNSKGSRMPTTGPGTDRTDGILGIGSNGVPTSWVDKGEWIINGRSSEKYHGLLAAINRDDPRLKNLPAYAEGGRNGITNALSAAMSVNGNKYLWGGTGPTNFDCSGFVGWLHQIVMGVTGSIKRLYTTYNLMGSSGVGGLQPGLGPAGTQFQVGVSQEHMAATVGGHSAESGGAHGTSGLDNGRANAQSGQFPKKWHLPNALVAGWVEGQQAATNSGAGVSTARKAEWTEANQLALEKADLDITAAKEARDKVYADSKKSQNDRDIADKKVEQAEQRVLDLQKKKDDAAAGVDEGPAPQAPGMAQAFSEAEMERLEAQMSVDDANERRNEVYAKADSTENDRRRADIALQKAENSLAEILKGKKKEGDKDYSLAGIGKTFAHSAVDALFTGLEGQDYFGIGQSRWVTTDWSKLAGEPAIDAPEAAPFTQAQIAAQTGGMTVQQILEERLGIKAPKVFDNGGWLRPGETAINLSNKPEPIFNSPAQLSQFTAGEGLKPAAPTVQDFSVTFNGDVSTRDDAELVSKLRFEQKRLVYGLTGG
ncbi:MAG: tape measure protein [Rhodococcus erythropolis]